MTTRTIKRLSQPLKGAKLATVQAVAESYAAEKQYWLKVFQGDVAAIGDQRSVRNQARAAGHKPVGGLPSTVWVAALKDGDHIELHYGTAVESPEPQDGEVLAVDFGYSEVIVDSNGNHHGERFGSLMTAATEERTAFKALAGCAGHQQVNPAYSSQTCPSCGFVHRDNRRFDTFQCGHCGYAAHANEVAAVNLVSRMSDDAITRYTPYRQVKGILQDRFQRRQECEPIALVTLVTARCQRGPLTPGLEIRDEEAQAT